MKISVIGTGYVGLSTGVCLAEIGHTVTCIDIDQKKIQHLQKGIPPFYEPGMEEMIIHNLTEKRLFFSSSHRDGVAGADIAIIAVGTPQKEDGSCNLAFLEEAAINIAPFLEKNSIIVIKSTVPIGTNETIQKLIESRFQKKLQIVSNPEFLRQGSAIFDTLHPDRIVIGSESKDASEKIAAMYLPLNAPILTTSIRSAEMIKYASNAFLATKISYINYISNLCEQVGADVEAVAKGMGTDKRISPAFLQAGIGYGGSCFPKDVKALLAISEENGVNSGLLQEAAAINEHQQTILINKALQRFQTLKGKRFALLGLSFKPETDDMREAPSIPMAKQLAELGANVIAYDPKAIHNAKKILGSTIQYTDSIDDAVLQADAIFIVTEWNEIKNMDIGTLLKTTRSPIVFDGRNCFDEKRLKSCDSIEYYSIGRPVLLINQPKNQQSSLF
ncbi:UDP-glucose/GDP-mannose dehydrogenase family protein [Niallia sp. NCCP-28]|uniref:UDP-glucose dehydrogenase family protein n=1 Tax=Niallia sp. NCCP-28 TaxID=2934712 RepID=UPI0020889CEF|nr:UDP-glucose/GDP-mannose dehydrogenase family protein [Niallia sp. NCCP-28]GKU82897.1 UDP-glucose 6-dehydrogenase YwqF [Niallia sp. NCCP-28]